VPCPSHPPWLDHYIRIHVYSADVKLALTSPAGCGRSVGIVRLRTKTTEFSLVLCTLNLCMAPAILIEIFMFFLSIPVWMSVVPWTIVLPHPYYTTLCLKRLWGYVISSVGNLPEDKSSCVQRDFRYGDFGSHLVLKSSNTLIVTSVSGDDAR
jgi:hypothetical protein